VEKIEFIYECIKESCVRKVECKVKVKNVLGLHARPATVIAKLLQDCKSQVKITSKEETVDARSIIGVLMLAVKKNMQVTLTAEGEDAEEIIGKLVEAFENQFGELLSDNR
jgi:phosphocarrier protein